MGEGVLTPEYGGTLRIGAKVRRGRDWCRGNMEGGPGGEGVLVRQGGIDGVYVKWDHSGRTICYDATSSSMPLEYAPTAAEKKAERERKERVERERVERERVEKERKKRERKERERVERERVKREREREEREKADAEWVSLHGRKEIETLRERAAE
eukprot:g13039.t1